MSQDNATAVGVGGWRRFVAGLPMRTALLAVAVVWLLGCVWSYQEQSAFAASRQFVFPHLLPLVIDGFAVSMAGVSWAASLDARPAVLARLATVIAVSASSVSNGVWAYLRTRHDLVTVVLGVAVPIAAALAFEVLLAEMRRQVQRGRGLPAPVAVPYPRLIRLALAPWQTTREWRALVLELTAIDHPTPSPATAGAEAPSPTGEDTTANQVGPEPPEPPAENNQEARERGRAGLELVRPNRSTGGSGDPCAGGVDVSDLLVAGRQIAAELGYVPGRRPMLEALRRKGMGCSTDRASALVAALRDEYGAAPAGGQRASVQDRHDGGRGEQLEVVS
jgi:hypothetical protein